MEGIVSERRMSEVCSNMRMETVTGGLSDIKVRESSINSEPFSELLLHPFLSHRSVELLNIELFPVVSDYERASEPVEVQGFFFL